MSARRFVCIHGHFYQPPRDNPWLEAIARQPSAWPAHDWNERVADECYAPNARARILDGEGRIRRMTNNYARISFNFGPTLMSWLEAERPEVHAAIVDADRQSRDRYGGCGSALAQVYGHVILPLANERDKQTQVRWGIVDFEHRFARKPEGMWLAETAVDIPSLEAMAAEGIAFTILAPHQCARVRDPEQTWHDVRGQRVDPRRPYFIRLPSGRRMTLFFYDGPTSRAVAFERLLDDGRDFANRLLAGFDEISEEAQLVHIATDGETYGHHHDYGDMALAYCLDELEQREGVELVNYARLLQLFPPTWEAEIVGDTSWSCVHGLERWRSDCGCNSGTGWHQRWRRPLRDAMDWLRDALIPLFESEGAALFRDPWAARDAYVDVLLDRSPAALARFWGAHARPEVRRAPSSARARERGLQLLEMQRHAMSMYTSCGWFFDDISGIETVQVIQYAARALQLADELFGPEAASPEGWEAEFEERLALAPCNREGLENGAQVYSACVRPSMVSLPKVAAHLSLAAFWEPDTSPLKVGGFRGEIVAHARERTGRAGLMAGEVRVASRMMAAAERFSFVVLHFGDHNLLAGVRPFVGKRMQETLVEATTAAFGRADLTEVIREIERFFEGHTYSLRDVFPDEQSAILRRLLKKRIDTVERSFDYIYDQSAPLLRFLRSIDQPAPVAFQAVAEHTLSERLERDLSAGTRIDLAEVERWLDEAQQAQVALNPAKLGAALVSTLEQICAAVVAEPGELGWLKLGSEVGQFAAAKPWPMDLERVQFRLYRLVEARLGGEGDPSAGASALGSDATRLLLSFASSLNLRTEAMERHL